MARTHKRWNRFICLAWPALLFACQEAHDQLPTAAASEPLGQALSDRESEPFIHAPAANDEMHQVASTWQRKEESCACVTLEASTWPKHRESTKSLERTTTVAIPESIAVFGWVKSLTAQIDLEHRGTRTRCEYLPDQNRRWGKRIRTLRLAACEKSLGVGDAIEVDRISLKVTAKRKLPYAKVQVRLHEAPPCGGPACSPSQIDDGNPCTRDACSAEGEPVHEPVPSGESCSDQDACNGLEVCDGAGICSAGQAPPVDDGNTCTVDQCDPATGVTHTPVVAGTSCADVDACNGAEKCDATGECAAGAPLVCDDNDACNGVETCVASAGCVSGAPLVCDDGNVCTGSESCDPRQGCVAGDPVDLDDNNACTTDACDPQTGAKHAPVPDGTACTMSPCSGGACAGTCEAGRCRGAGLQLFNTGVDESGAPLPGGSIDPHYALIQSPDPEYSGPNVVVASTIAEGYWEPQSDVSRWIAPTPNQSYPQTPTPCLASGVYVYRTRFVLAGEDPQRFRIVGRWGADNYGIAIRINGSDIGTERTGYTPLSPFVVDAGFVAGENTLDFELEDIGCPNGLRVELTYSIGPDGGDCNEPGLVCNDGNPCNGVETCAPESRCLRGQPPVIDDGNPCTQDSCDIVGGVTHEPVATGTPCADGRECAPDGQCVPIENLAPSVDAGADLLIQLPASSVDLRGAYTDDGLPLGSTPTTLWSVVTGAGSVLFGDANAQATSATFETPGVYVLRFTVNDSMLQSGDDVTVEVRPPTTGLTVDVGPDQELVVPTSFTVTGTVAGQTDFNMLTTSWSQSSGPGEATFDRTSELTTMVALSSAGIYVLRLTVSNANSTASDEITIRAIPELPFVAPTAIVVQPAVLPDLSMLPVGPDGLPQIYDSAEGSISLDPTRKTPLTGMAGCVTTVTSCMASSPSFDACVMFAPVCSTAEFWLEPVCCPARCAEQYEHLRVDGSTRLHSFEATFLTLPTCFRGVAEMVGRP